MKATVLTIVFLHIFVPLTQNGYPKVELKFFRAKFIKIP